VIFGALPVSDFRNSTIPSMSEKLRKSRDSVSRLKPSGPDAGRPRK